jgi:hypothetical protein
MSNKKARVIAFYLPQYHPIPENDEWWGKGFTEWTNVAKAKPLFRGHYQPHLPADLGYYDLRVPEIREQQAEMAKYAGIEGFVYYHYWFGGKRILERPFEEVLKSGKPAFPFCLAWANETWSGIWHGNPNRILIEQTYPGEQDYIKHFYSILDAFTDDRYIRINNRPIFYIYNPLQIPNVKAFLNCWNELAAKNGLNQIFFIARCNNIKDAEFLINQGYDAIQTNWLGDAMTKSNKVKSYWNRFSRKMLNSKINSNIWDYSKLYKFLINESNRKQNYFPTLLSGWDNSPRSGKSGYIFINYNPEVFEKHLRQAIDIVQNKDIEERFIFLKSWNEWAEGNYVEPEARYGWKFLTKLKENIFT